MFSDDSQFGDKVNVTIIATGVDMMGAVPEDYYSKDRAEKPREENPVVVETTPTDEPKKEKEESSTAPSAEPERPKFLRNVLGKIQDGVTKIYDDMQ